MSGVFIAGMEMPDRCFDCPMCDIDCCGVSKGSYIEYREVDIDIAIDHRPDWCPLAPVPKHGQIFNVLKTERDCVSRDCDRNCGKCDLSLERDEILYAYDTIIALFAEPADKERK